MTDQLPYALGGQGTDPPFQLAGGGTGGLGTAAVNTLLDGPASATRDAPLVGFPSALHSPHGPASPSATTART
ncbi:hypothetical protein [Nocardiopsis lambiniae]|uniref:Uncharacterized protein n=1 Tax=Nocardiopsis lambiniae TaxID=3075539 RepID=A0ABU2MBE2_9ACTN|nr:hypothetical protein [Nocardiopsis sp. DSM 44743]MDT0329919.1 hypothetical protein [Nocardiopsis sp. DSM 44743]